MGVLPSIFWDILLMAEFLHQLIGNFSHYLQGLYIPGGAGFLPSTVSFELCVCVCAIVYP